MGSENRGRQEKFLVRVNEAELAAANKKVEAFSYRSKAALVRDLLMDVEPKSTLDQQAILELVKVNADQGRLGGLLKHWLRAVGADKGMVTDIRTLLKDIERTQKELKKRIMAL
ncbi:MAG: hypothetical protein GY927_04120 [bacterium]|nr:hypothetical protein [bacterium]